MRQPLWPTLGYQDAPAAIRFLLAAFGFEEIVIYHGENEGIIAHAELQWPEGGTIMIHSTEPDHHSITDLAKQAAKTGGYPAFAIHIDTENPEALYKRAVAAGARVVREMRDSPRGRGFIVSDPEGLYWSFGTPLPKLVRNAKGEWQPA